MKKEFKYKIKQNNYVGLLFFALVLAASLYIIKHETQVFDELESSPKNIIMTEKESVEIVEENDQISKLRQYLNVGDPNTFKIYQSMYINDDVVSVDNLNIENLLYMAYRYIMKNTDVSNYLSYITCEQATMISLDSEIIQCGGNKVNSSYYTVNSYITKELLKETVRTLYNININDFTNFYTTNDNLCYFVNNEYICVSKTSNLGQKNVYTESNFVRAIKTEQKIEIIENYKYVLDGIYYNGFMSDEIGERQYISTFIKVNGKYYWTETKPYQED